MPLTVNGTGKLGTLSLLSLLKLKIKINLKSFFFTFMLREGAGDRLPYPDDTRGPFNGYTDLRLLVRKNLSAWVGMQLLWHARMIGTYQDWQNVGTIFISQNKVLMLCYAMPCDFRKTSSWWKRSRTWRWTLKTPPTWRANLLGSLRMPGGVWTTMSA